MTPGYISMNTHGVSQAGNNMKDHASEARSRIKTVYARCSPASDKNKNFTSAPALVDFMSHITEGMDHNFKDLEKLGASLLASAHDTQEKEEKAAEAMRRIDATLQTATTEPMPRDDINRPRLNMS
ncbi:hypothetical protein KEM60_02935 [Austwickia sp. TVS 96-490-7B]|nr:hypothetical protein [Austwickia sp. TVS 96-490-7B]